MLGSRKDPYSSLQDEKDRHASAQGYGLAVASRDGDLDAVRELLKKGASPNWADATPLQWACHRGQTECVRLLLNSKADHRATHKHDGRNALHYACARGNIECVTLLLSKGAQDDAQDLNGRKAFHLAYMNNHLSVVELLQKNQTEIATPGPLDLRSTTAAAGTGARRRSSSPRASRAATAR